MNSWLWKLVCKVSYLENLKKQKELWLDSESLESLILKDEYGIILKPCLSKEDFEALREFMIKFLSKKIDSLI